MYRETRTAAKRAPDKDLRCSMLRDATHVCRGHRVAYAPDASSHSSGATGCCLPRSQTVFTRFIPASYPGEGSGTWKRYYQRWPSITLEHLGRDKVDLVAELASLVRPAHTVDKHVYSPRIDNTLQTLLQARGVDTLVITGSETDVCVLATVLGAIDRGYRVVVPSDAICSSADETHDASLRLYQGRYGQQVEIATTEQILLNWK
jgi:nicotinamidase-related amidase